MPRKVCKWTQIEPNCGVYNTCQEGEEFHLTPGLDLYPYCMWCGGKIAVGVELPECVPVAGHANHSVRRQADPATGSLQTVGDKS